MFDRFELLIGKKIELLKTKTVMVIGLGGVGGSAFNALVRSGIQKIIVIDADTIDITNLNRQALAYQNTIGKQKVAVAKETALNINPNCHVITHAIYLTKENVDDYLKENIDFVIDAVDDIKVKIEIIKKCLKKNIPFISVMGTGNKMQPELLEIKDIRKTEYDVVAKKIRHIINKEKIKGKIPVVFSKEKPILKDKIGSSTFVPNVAGLLASKYVINKFLEEDYE